MINRKFLVITLFPAVTCGMDLPEEIKTASLSPSYAPVDITLANGQPLAQSRYARILTPSEETVRVIFDGVTESALEANFSLDSVQFTNNDKLSEFLKNAGLRESVIEDIVRQNEHSGFRHSPLCQGDRSQCIPASKNVDFVIDYYQKAVRIVASPDNLNSASGEKSFVTLNGGPGLVNNISAYYYDSLDSQEPLYYLRDKGVAGAGAGFFRYDIFRSNDQTEVYDLNYNHALPAGNKVLLGRTLGSSTFNPSSQQSIISDVPLSGIRLGTAEELVDRSYGERVLNFYSPTNGVVEVRKQGALIYATGTNAGYNELNLANLPAGQYNALIEVKAPSGAIVSSQNVLVNNTGTFSSDFSWHLSGGRSTAQYNDFAAKDEMIVETGVQFPLGTLSALYLGTAFIEDNSLYSTGLLFKSEKTSVSAKAGAGTHGFRYYELSSYMDNLSLSWRRILSDEGWNNQKHRNSSTNLSVSYSVNPFSDMSLSAGYMYSSSQNPYTYMGGFTGDMNSPVATYYKGEYKTESAFLNAYYNFTGGSTVYLSGNKELGNDNYTISLGFSIPLGSDYRLSNITSFNNDQLINSSTAEYSSQLSERWTHSISAGAQLARENYSSLSYNLSHNSPVYRGSGYFYTTDKGQKQVRLSAESTQVISSEGIHFSPGSWMDTAFVIRGKGADYDIAVKNMSDNSTRYLNPESEIVSVPAYQKINVKSDTGGSQFVFADRLTRSSETRALVPGSVVVVDKETISTQSTIVTLKNADGKFALSATCGSESCLSLSRLSQGVFRVKYTGNHFVLQSEGQECNSADVQSAKFINIFCKSITQG